MIVECLTKCIILKYITYPTHNYQLCHGYVCITYTRYYAADTYIPRDDHTSYALAHP